MTNLYCDTCMAQIDNCICNKPRCPDPHRMEAKHEIKTKVEEKEWLEYKFFCALHDLKEVAPDHYLVTTVEMALQARPALLKRQAD